MIVHARSPIAGEVYQCFVTTGQEVRPGDVLVYVIDDEDLTPVRSRVAGKVVRVLQVGERVGVDWPVVELMTEATGDLVSIEAPPGGPLALALTHDGFEAHTPSLGSQLNDAAIMVVAVGVTLATVWTFWGLFRAIALGTASTRGFWCLILAPGLLYWAWQTRGTRLLRSLRGARHLTCTADHLDIRGHLGSDRVALRRITDCLPAPEGLLLQTVDGDRLVRMARPEPAQTAWLARAVRAAAEQARQTPLPPEPPEDLNRLRRS